MTTSKFVFRPSFNTDRHTGSISLRVIHDRIPKTVSLGYRLLAQEWDAATQTTIYPTDDSERTEYLKGIDECLRSCAEKVASVLQKLEKTGMAYTTTDVITRLRQWTDSTYLTGYTATLSADLVENGQHRTARAYTTVCRGLVSFHNGKDIPLREITPSLVKRFETHLKEEGKQPNTISFIMRNLRAIYNKAVGAGLIDKGEKPFSGVFTGVDETRKRALNAKEVNRIMSIEFDSLLLKQEQDTGNTCQSRKRANTPNLYFSQQMFLFCLYAHGMSFIDLCYLKKSQLKNGIIRYYRKKTGKQIEVPVNTGMRRIIKRFEHEVKDSDYLFPLLTKGCGNMRRQYETALRTQNNRLKQISILAGLDEGLSTHVARHSWASILKSKLQPLSVISEGLGHSSEKITRKYLAAFDRSILAKAGKTVLTAITRSTDTSAALS